MNSLILTQAKVLDFISNLQKQNLLTESEHASIKQMTISKDPMILQTLLSFDKTKDEQALKNSILNIIKPSVECPSGDAELSAANEVEVEEEPTSPLGDYLMNAKKKRAGGMTLGSLTNLLKPCFE